MTALVKVTAKSEQAAAPVSLFETFIPIYIETLRKIRHVVYKALEDANIKKTHMMDIAGWKLSTDAPTFEDHMNSLCDSVKLFITTVIQQPVKCSARTKKIGHMREISYKMIDDVLEALQEFNKEDFMYKDSYLIIAQTLGERMTGLQYVQFHGLPALHFHAAMIYAILRKGKLCVDEIDFLNGE